MTNSPVPSAQRAETFRTMLGFVLVAAIAGVTLVLAGFAGALMDVGFQPARLGWQVPLVTAVRLAAGFMMARIAYRGTRHGEMPSEQAIVSVPALICLSILVDRLV